MNQDNNFNQNNFNSQGNNGMTNNQPINNQSFNQNVNVNQQTTPSFQQPIMQDSKPQSMNTFENSTANNSNFNNKPPKKINLGLIIGIIAVIAVAGVGIVLGSKLLPNDRNNNSGNNNEIENNNNNNNGNNSTNNEQKEDSNFYENWGFRDVWSAKTPTSSENFIINFPNYRGYTEGSGIYAEQLDGTAVILSGQNHRCPEISTLSELFPAYFEQLEFTLEAIYGLLSDNFEILVESKKQVTINDYNMYKFNGNIKFDYDGAKRNYQFVSYATQLKSNGAYAYWVVYDVSDVQSNGELIAEHALNMAKTFREEN